MDANSISAAAEFLGQDAEDVLRILSLLRGYIEEAEVAQSGRGPALNRIKRDAYKRGLVNALGWLPAVEVAAGLAAVERRLATLSGSVTEKAAVTLELRRHEEAIARLGASDDRELFTIQLGALRLAWEAGAGGRGNVSSVRAKSPVPQVDAAIFPITPVAEASTVDETYRRASVPATRGAAPSVVVSSVIPPVHAPPRFVSGVMIQAQRGRAVVHILATEPAAEGFEAAALPMGWELDPKSGRLSGVPSDAGVFTFEVAARRGALRVSAWLTVHVDLPPPPSEILVPPELHATAGQAFRCEIGSAPTGLALTVEGMPSGIQFDPASRSLHGVPQQAGTSLLLLHGHHAHEVVTRSVTLAVRPARPRLILPELGPITEGSPLDAEISVEHGPAQLQVNGLPPGIVFDASGRLSGSPQTAGLYPVDIMAVSDGGVDRRRLILDVQPLEPQVAPAMAFTVCDRNRRRLIGSAAPVFRLGRMSEGSYAVCLCVKHNPTASKTLALEISRQHAELYWAENGLMVRDGWSPTGKPSTFGTYLDSERVPTQGVAIRHHQVLRLTRREPGEAVAHWRVHLQLATEVAPKLPASLKPIFAGGVSAAWLQRLDNVAEDILLLPVAADLHALGRTQSSVWVARVGDGFLAAGNSGRSVGIEGLSTLASELQVMSPTQMVSLSFREILEISMGGPPLDRR